MKAGFSRIGLRPGLRHLGSLFVLALLLATMACAHGYWRLVWNDEFNDNNLDPNKWTFDLGNGFTSGGVFVPGWGNNELQYYTSCPENVTVSNGVVHIIARKEAYQRFNSPPRESRPRAGFSKSMVDSNFEPSCPRV
jgi:beta-glucanase (GH16 family)